MPLNLYDLGDVLINCNVIVLFTSKTYRVYMVTVLEIGIMVSNEYVSLVVSQWLKENLFCYRKALIVRVLTPIKTIAQMKHRANIFPFKYWVKSALVELSLEGCELKIIILAAEVCICNYCYFQLFSLSRHGGTGTCLAYQRTLAGNRTPLREPVAQCVVQYYFPSKVFPLSVVVSFL